MWYVNLYVLSRSSQKSANQRLFSTFAIGIVIMFGLAWIQQLVLTHINFGPVMLMIEVRGWMINLICYTSLHLLQQNYENCPISFQLEQMKVEAGDEDAVAFILKLSNFYHYTLESHKSNLITEKEEMEIVRAFLFLQNARFEGGFTFTIASILKSRCNTSMSKV